MSLYQVTIESGDTYSLVSVLASSREEAGRRALDKLGKVRSAVVDISPEEVVL